MKDFGFLIKNFFTHKDFLPPASQLPGVMFTPLHFVFAAIVLAIVVVGAIFASKSDEKRIKRIFTIIWACMVVFEATKIIWESTAGKTVRFEAGGVLPLYPCSVFMYAMPFAIWGKDYLKKAGCGFVCTIGMIGGSINFFYPATILPRYSCISFAGFHTFFYHGAMLFTCLTMLISGYHRYRAKTVADLFMACLPLLIVSIPANIVNYSPIGSDYMFFRGTSFIFNDIFGAWPDPLATVVFYVAYIVIPTAFYLPSFIANKRKAKIAE